MLFVSNRVSGVGQVVATLCALLIGGGCQTGAGQTASIAHQRRVASAPQRPAFDGEAAMELLRAQCAFGPRVPGTEAHRRTRAWMVAELEKYAEKVEVQDFSYRGLSLSNVIAWFNQKASRRVLLCAHWDSRPMADMEILPLKRRQPILGANDGASGVAVLLQLAKAFHAQAPPVGVMLVMLDGEDYGDFERDEGVFLGSRHFARMLPKAGRPAYGILLDMVGDKDLTIYREGNSEQRAGRINDQVFRVAGELGYRRYFPNNVRYTISDDHIAINDAGVPCIDLIDFDYAHWHTLDDTPDKCSAQSLRVVGETVAEVVYREGSR